MTPISLLVVADRGNLKAFKVEDTPNRGPSLQLVQAFEITDAHGRYQDKFTDQAGRFPVGTAGEGGTSSGEGRHANAIAERQNLETENDRRIHKQLADHLEEIVRKEAPEGWSFAAPASINSTVVDLLTSDIRDRIVENVKSDLVNIDSAKLPTHFKSLQSV